MTRSLPHARRGVALMLALWLVVVLGALGVQVAAAAREESRLVGNVKARVAARYAAESGIIAARARIESLLDSAKVPTQRVRLFNRLDSVLASLHEVDVGSARFTAVAVDLNARLDLNLAPAPMLLPFFRQFAGERETRSVVDALEDWRDADSLTRAFGAEARDYQRARASWVPRNGPLQRVEELRRVQGMTEELAGAVAPYVGVGGDGRVNINTAPESVLAAFPGLGRGGARAIVSRRRAGELFTSVGFLAQLLGGSAGATFGVADAAAGVADAADLNPASFALNVATTEPSRLLLVSRGWLHGHPLTHEIEAVFGVVGRRLVLHSWRERDR